MKVAVEELESCKRKLAVEAGRRGHTGVGARVRARAEAGHQPGFRRGRVPRSLVKLHFADDVRREVAEHLIPDVYRKALTEAHIDPVNEPDLQDLTLEEGAPLSFTAVVEVKPAIALGDYRGVEVQHAPAPVTDEDVGAALERMREQHAQYNSVERPAAPGDLVVVDYTCPEAHEPTTPTLSLLSQRHRRPSRRAVVWHGPVQREPPLPSPTTTDGVPGGTSAPPV